MLIKILINKSLNRQYTEDVMGNNCLISIRPKELKNYVIKKPYLTCEYQEIIFKINI